MTSRFAAGRPFATRPIAVAVDVFMWTVQVLLAAYFVYSAALPFGDGLAGKFTESGVGQCLRSVTGVRGLACAVGLVVPFFCGLAALGLAGVMAGAVATELFLLANGDAGLPALLGGLALSVAVTRWSTVRTALAKAGLTHSRTD